MILLLVLLSTTAKAQRTKDTSIACVKTEQLRKILADAEHGKVYKVQYENQLQVSANLKAQNNIRDSMLGNYASMVASYENRYQALRRETDLANLVSDQQSTQIQSLQKQLRRSHTASKVAGAVALVGYVLILILK